MIEQPQLEDSVDGQLSGAAKTIHKMQYFGKDKLSFHKLFNYCSFICKF